MSLLLAGIFTGFLVAVLVLETSLRDYDGSVYTQVRQVELDALDTLATATLLPALIATAVLAFAARREDGRSFRLTLAALVLLACVVVTTLVVNVPINSDQADWDVQAPPSDWADDRDRWQTAHAVRTVVALAAFSCLCLATRVRSAVGRSTPAS